MYQRIFVIVLDSLGVGAMPDSKEYGDIGVDTFGHIGEKMGTMQIPNLQKLGFRGLSRWNSHLVSIQSFAKEVLAKIR